MSEPAKQTKEKLDKSFPASLRRIAEAWRAAEMWDAPTAAKALDDEAELLDPKPEPKS